VVADLTLDKHILSEIRRPPAFSSGWF
jgi:hypothetical protein